MATNERVVPRGVRSQQMGRDASQLSGRGLTVILLSAALTMVDFFIVNVALPSIANGFGSVSGMLEWVVAGYGGAYAILLVLGGRLGDTWGRRRLAVVGLIGFTVTSAACGFAPNIAALIGARVLQGASAALLLPQTLATIQASLVGEKKGRAIGLYGAVGGLAAVVGQVLGGVLVSWNVAGLGWRPIFLVNVPIGLLLLMGIRWVPETRVDQVRRIDGRGTSLFAIVMVALVTPLTLGPMFGWPWWTWASFALAVGAGWFLLPLERSVEKDGRSPLVPPALIGTSGMRWGLPTLAALGVAFGGFAFAFSIALQDGLHFGALASGLSLLPMAIGAFIAALYSNRLIGRFATMTLGIGGAVQALGLIGVLGVTLGWWPALSPWHFLPGMFLVGIGNGLLLPTAYRVVMSGVPAADAGAGSGILNTTQQAAMSVGVAAIGTIFSVLKAAHGDRPAFITVTIIWAAVAVVVALVSFRIPHLLPRTDPARHPPRSAAVDK
jgi:MFS family permease